MRVRATIVSIHVWLGITLGFFWALQGLTGGLLVFNRDVERWTLHETASGPVLPLDQLFSKAASAAGAPVREVETFGPARTLFMAYYDDRNGHARSLVIDGRSGAVRDWRDPEPKLPAGGSAWRWLLHLHEAVLMGDRGGMLVGASGVLLISSLIGGGVLGWPRAQRWAAAFSTRRWRTTGQKLFGWHRMMGIVILLPLGFTALCGAYLALAPEIKPLLIAHAGYRPPYKAAPAPRLPAHMISAQSALDRARAAFPDASLVRAIRPSAKTPVYTFRLLQPGEARRWAGTTTVSVDPATGRILNVYNPLRGPLANALTDDIYPMHTGEIGGLGARLLLMFAGLALPVLYVTGVWAWFHRRRTVRAASAFETRP